MPPLLLSRDENMSEKKRAPRLRRPSLAALLLTAGAFTLGCGGGGAGSVAPPPPPPPSIIVGVTPASGTALLGQTLAFTANVSNTADTAVLWSVNGIPGGSPQAGTISAAGLYTAPADLPQGGTVQVTATSHADTSKSSTALVTISSDVSVTLTPGSAAVELGAAQTFRASITSGGHPDTAVRWSLSGAACPGACGTLDGSGVYTAPQILPASPGVTITATSVADPSRQASASVTITSNFTLQLAAPASLSMGATNTLLATLTPAPGSNPSTALSWSLAGTGCTGSACGILSATTTSSAGGGTAIAEPAGYTAPAAATQTFTVTITVTPQADPTKKAQANIVIEAGGTLAVTPTVSTLAANHRVTLVVAQTGAAAASFNWSVNGTPGGSATVGQICVTGSLPCQPVTTTGATQVDYVAPGAIPAANPLSVRVTSAADAGVSAVAQITVINHVLVSVLPNNVTLPPMAVQSFTASVLGTANQNVVWQIAGSACTGGGCGSITPLGVYTAPPAPPAPDALQVVAISQDDISQSGSASVSIFTGANLLSLHPASVYAGGANGFTLRVNGSGFVPSSPGPGSALVIGGAARVTSCLSPNVCTAPVMPADVAQAGSLAVKIQNPDNSVSNVLSLVVVAPSTTSAALALDTAQPAVTGKDLVVVEPTSAGLDSDAVNLDLAVAAAGAFDTATNLCSLGGSPIPLVRPVSGTASADICVFSQAGFDTGMNYTVSGNGDVAVISRQPAGLGVVHLTLQLPATAATGSRTLFVQNANLDRTAASGVLEIR